MSGVTSGPERLKGTLSVVNKYAQWFSHYFKQGM
ncbi:hypothetical protein EV682_101162 [Iodobacter fluviatilis]|uniref:Uncharacterized protein n=1 Tax=Iodobacter fluviatilis TaxID=537 RepID=A0A377Q3L4_9NEIS|nr:hypothetical protein EV682_101162 [Iodobacter fluviatilis]STQ89169.1 Uncharacterised protein [Iodobacter fluviatilis]